MSPPADVIMGAPDEDPPVSVAVLNGSRALEASLYLASQNGNSLKRGSPFSKLLQPLAPIQSPIPNGTNPPAGTVSGGTAGRLLPGALNPLKRPLFAAAKKTTVLPPLTEKAAANRLPTPEGGLPKQLGEGQKKIRLAEELQPMRKPRGVRGGSGAGQQTLAEDRPWFLFLKQLRERRTSLEFIYLRPAKQDVTIYNPYDLEIVGHSDVDQNDFYTMSMAGVTRFMAGTADFTPLDQWEREYHLFNLISTLKIYRQYKSWKSFATWKRFVRQKKMHACRAVLERNLFFLNPMFQKPLQQIKKVCHEVSALRMHKVEDGVLYTLELFISSQHEKKEQIGALLREFSEGALDTVCTACQSALDALDEKLFGKGDADAAATAGDTRSRTVTARAGTVTAALKTGKLGGAAAQTKRPGQEADGERFSYAITAARRSEQRKLLNFIRLADYMLCGSLHSLLIESIQEILARMIIDEADRVRVSEDASDAEESTNGGEEMQVDGGQTQGEEAGKTGSLPLFRVEVVMDEDQLVFEPSQIAFQTKVGDVLQGFLQTLEGVERVLHHERLAQFVEQEGHDPPEAGTLTELVGDELHSELMEEVRERFLEAFRGGEKFAAYFLPLLKLTIEDRAVTIEGMREQVFSGARTLDTFRDDLARFTAQQADITALPETRDVGILRLSSAQLKTALLPGPVQCLQKISSLLPQLAAAKYQEFISEVHDATARLTANPGTVEEFVEHVRFLQTMLARRDEFEDRYAEVVRHYSLMEEVNITVPEMDYAAYQTLNPDFLAFKNAIDVAEAGKDDQVKGFSSDLEAQSQGVQVAVTEIRQQAQSEILLDENADQETVLGLVGKLVEDVGVQQEKAKNIKKYQQLFQVPESEFDDIRVAAEEVELKRLLWEGGRDWADLTDGWAATSFQSIDVASLEEMVQKYVKQVMKLERGLPPNKLVPELKRRVEEYKLMLPVISNLRNKALKDRHWERIEAELGQPIDVEGDLTLGSLLDMHVTSHKDVIATVSTEATQEQALEELLKKVQGKWADVEFAVKPYKDSKDVFILGGVEDVTAALEDSMVTMGVITASRYVAGIRTEVEKLEKALRLFQEVLDSWLECQKNWMYLESIFSAPDIQRQLPNEAKAFASVDKQFKEIMRRTRDRSNALQAGTTPGWLEIFAKSNESLEKIQKNLEDYLETKRMAFPRFYFLSNDELLEILAQTRNVQAVQPHMSKCFDGIRSLDFGDDPKSIDIFAMVSSENERVNLGKNLKARGNVEQWLTSVEQNMVQSLRKLAKSGYLDYPKKERKQWVLQQAAQLVLMVSQIYWCRDVEACLAAGAGDDAAAGASGVAAALSAFRAQCVRQLEQLSELVRGKLASLERKILAALITIDVHARDIVENMLTEKIFSANDFGWQMQLRYYWDDAVDDCIVKQTNARFIYGYEYLGAQSRLVITPLTDRCYMTLTGALHLKLGGAPAGPAGTGKTETTKDLGKCLGIQCVVFNCGDNLDYKFMGKFFAGLAQCGAWACFDEFNRIDIEVLSVVAQQLLTIQNALKAGQSKFNFEGREIRLVQTCGVFITMNPGYAGRTELPDNLKVLFRPVSMMIPDYALVAEVMLFSEGFANAKTLSRKMVKLYKLSSEQLSQQDHYDFGMRAVKSVLVMAGSLKRANPDLDEDAVLIRAFKDSNLPKFLAQDVELFLALLSDLFPGVTIPAQDYGELQSAIEACIEEAGLQRVSNFVTKVIQLYETMNVRFGVMAVGPTGGGKTTCYRMLQAAMTRLRAAGHANPSFQNTQIYVLNPKCIKMGELYGEYNLLSNEWRDGLASTIIRQCVADTTQDRKWVVFDGPVDAIWIENMNTVLDDNCVLCLPNGERIKLNPTTMRMLFEVQDLAVASPATVSRCGMVYVPPEELGWRPYVKSWLQRLSKELSTEDKAVTVHVATIEHVWGLFEGHVDKGLAFVRQKCAESIPSVDINLVTSLCFYFQALCAPARGVEFAAAGEPLHALINKLFCFAYIWSLGGNIAAQYQDAFDAFCREQLAPVTAFPGAGTVYDYFVEPKEGAMVAWDEVVAPFVYRPELPFFALTVPTVDTTRYSFLMEIGLEVQRSVLFTGVSGVGKSAIITDLLNRTQGPKNLVPVTVNFSAQTTSLATQELIESKLEKKRKTRFGAPPGKKIVLFVDDVNMPVREKYGAQPPVELLRQFQDFRGFYDRQKLFWKDVDDMTIVCACAPPGGGRNDVTPRFLRHFSMLCVPQPSDGALRTIFGGILGGFLGAFNAECKGLAKPIVESSVEVYARISRELLPTPAKSHYTFNLRDVSKVFQGILMVTPRDVPNKKVLTSLWVHESMRVFHDRLIDSADKRYFTGMLHEILKRNFDEARAHDEVFAGPQPVIFGDYLRPGATGEDRHYEQVTDIEKLSVLLEDYLADFNAGGHNGMKLVFFRDAIDHISRMARILRQPRGNAMLVGVGGSGKQSLTRFACFMADYQCFQIELTRGYGNNEFREDLKKLYRLAGVTGKPVAFLFTDTQIVNEGFLEDINNLLNSGEVPGLFASDEKERIIGDIREWCQQNNVAETRDSMYQAFIARVRENLHVVLCMSPVGDAFRARCRQFPSLINCCTIDWYTQWPEEALLSVSTRFLQNQDLGSADVRDSVAKMCVEIHTSVTEMSDRFYQELRRKFYTTPKSYLDLINLYTQLLGEKRLEMNNARDRLVNGLNKLRETNEIVGTMKKELDALAPILAEKTETTKELLKQVTADQAAAQQVKDVVSKEEAEVKEQTARTQAIKDDAQKDLDEALPALNSAVEALNALNKNDITEIKSFTKPPPLVQLTMEGVCVLLQEKTDWDTAKKVMSESGFVKRLVEFNKDAMSAGVLKKLSKYIEDPSFTPDAVAKQSAAAKSLCMWVRAMDVYARVARVVEPKKAVLRGAEEALARAAEALAAKQGQLAEVEAQVATLRQKLADAEAEQASLAQQAAQTTARLARAGQLTEALGDEQVRWADTAAAIGARTALLVGDVFLAAACISYYGAFTGPYREELVAKWIARCKEVGIPVSDNASLRVTLSNPVEVREWNIWGLPTDGVSLDNGVLVTRGRRWPLMIDPQAQANRWIKAMEAKNGLRVVKLTDPNFLRTLENSIRTGSPVLLEDIGESLDPALEPVLQKQVFEKQGRLLIRLGDSDVDYDPNFRFYMTTKMPNPHYMPDVCIKVTIVNFTVTAKGLEDQLLGDVVRKERSDLEEQKDRLLVSISNDKKQLQDLEDKVLKLLKESEGNILDDEVLINTLKTSKLTSGVIQGRVKEAEVTEKEINAAREQYRPVATRGSILYFVVADLALIDSMYQYSLTYFTQLFNYCIDVSEKSDDLPTRLGTLTRYITEFMYKNVSRGLFEEHKMIFSFLICTSILRNSGEIGAPEWNFLLRGSAGMILADKGAANPAPEWIGPHVWNNVRALSQAVPVFETLCQDIAAQLPEWRAFAAAPEPHAAPLPAAAAARGVDAFQKLLLVRVFREEKLVFAFRDFVRDKLGVQFVESAPLDLETVFKDTSAPTPIIFILSSGADPTGMLQRFGEKVDRRVGERLHIISLGQGQGPVAKALITKAMKSGDWVCLQNCHLASSWMLTLAGIVERFQQDSAEMHPDFRLWLTSMPSPHFPVPVLQNGIKITNEPPKGVRANLLRSYATLGDAYLDECSKRAAWKKLVFSVAFFHAVIQERRKFGPLGWNVRYDFNNSDLECALQTLKNFLEEQPEIPWPALLYVTGEITYGGRVTDDQDRRCLMCILQQYYTPKVLDDAYTFTQDGTYRVPPETDQNGYMEFVKRLPLTEGPAVFGMHENANITFQLQETGKIVETVLNMQPRLVSGTGTGKSPDEVVSDLAREIAEGLPAPLSKAEAGPGTFAPGPGGRLNSLAVVLDQESERFNKLLRVLVNSLAELQRAIKGLVVMSAELEAMYRSFLNNQVPAVWTAAAYPSLKPLSSWVKDFQQRMAFMRAWMVNGEPKCFWLPGFFFPQGFMTGALQNHARKYQIPIDTLNFGFKVMPFEDADAVPAPPDDGLYVSGLYIDGARWDRDKQCLVESLPGEMQSKLPVVHLIPTVNYKPPEEEYQCPLYKTSVRAGVLTTTGASSNYIFNVSLRIDRETTPEFWVRQGVALLTQTNL